MYTVSLTRHNQGGGVLENLLSQSTTIEFVAQDELKVSDRLLFSPNWGHCQGLVFFDVNGQKAALAHISIATDPTELITHAKTHRFGKLFEVPDIKEAFAPSSTVVVHVYHAVRNFHQKGIDKYSPDSFKNLLSDNNYTHFIDVPITGEDYVDRDIVVDPKELTMFILSNSDDGYLTITIPSAQ